MHAQGCGLFKDPFLSDEETVVWNQQREPQQQFSCDNAGFPFLAAPSLPQLCGTLSSRILQGRRFLKIVVGQLRQRGVGPWCLSVNNGRRDELLISAGERDRTSWRGQREGGRVWPRWVLGQDPGSHRTPRASHTRSLFLSLLLLPAMRF